MSPEMNGAIIGLIGAVVGALIGALGTWIVAIKTNEFQRKLAESNEKSQARAHLDSLVMKMLEFWMQYPQVEKKEVCEMYPNIAGHPNGKERYEAYCVFVFNMLMTAFKHFDQDLEKLSNYLGVEEIVRCHHRWWIHDRENLNYDEPFRKCIQSVIDKLRRDGQIA